MGQRPAHVKAPPYLSESPPVPTPESAAEAAQRRSRERATQALGKDARDPTRFGDWERDGIAVDF